IGVPAAVHMGQVEAPDSVQSARDREEVADGGGAPYLDDEDVPAAWKGIAQILGYRHALLEKGPIDILRREHPVGREIRKVDDEPGTKIVAVGVEGKQLHPARVDADQRFV